MLLFLVIEPLSGPDLRVRFVCAAVSCDNCVLLFLMAVWFICWLNTKVAVTDSIMLV